MVELRLKSAIHYLENRDHQENSNFAHTHADTFKNKRPIELHCMRPRNIKISKIDRNILRVQQRMDRTRGNAAFEA